MQFFGFLTGTKPALIARSLDALAEMIDTAGRMYAAATASLLDNESLELDLSAEDETINAYEQEIRRAMLEHVTLSPRDELALSLVLVAIVQDAERLGDLAKSIAKVAELADRPRMGAHVETLRPLRDRVQTAFPRVRAAFLSGDVESARIVMGEHERTKADVAAYLTRLAAAPDLTPNLAVVLASGGRMIGRTSAHLSNIISGVAVPFDQIRRAPSRVEEA